MKVIWFLCHFILPAVISFNKVLSFPLFCPSLHVYCMHVSVYMLVSMNTQVETRTGCWGSFLSFLLYHLRQVSLSFCWAGWLASSLDPSVFAPYYGRYAQVCIAMPNILPECLGFELRFSGLQSKHSFLVNHLPSLMVSFKILCLSHDVCHYQCIHSGFQNVFK